MRQYIVHIYTFIIIIVSSVLVFLHHLLPIHAPTFWEGLGLWLVCGSAGLLSSIIFLSRGSK